jgi:nucleoid-associated protein YgaU
VLHVQQNDKEADAYFLLALEKGDLLKAKLQRLKRQAEEEARRQTSERVTRAEEERLTREAAQAEERLQGQNRLKAAAEGAAAKAKAAPKEAPVQLPSTYTVRRGETLPQIAGRTEIYNDTSLWPLIYRANRDQIRDPKQLWPGQVLTIPRHYPGKK